MNLSLCVLLAAPGAAHEGSGCRRLVRSSHGESCRPACAEGSHAKKHPTLPEARNPCTVNCSYSVYFFCGGPKGLRGPSSNCSVGPASTPTPGAVGAVGAVVAEVILCFVEGSRMSFWALGSGTFRFLRLAHLHGP